MHIKKKNTKPSPKQSTLIKVSAAIYGLAGLVLAITPWLTFRVVEAKGITRIFSGLEVTGNVAWALVITGLGATILCLAALLGRGLPRYAPFLFSLTALTLSVFFILLVNQQGPSQGGSPLVLVSDKSLWNHVSNLMPRASIGPGIWVAATCSGIMTLLTFPLTRLPKSK